MRVGFAGLGRMGQAMAGRVLAAGHDLVVYNRTRSKAAELERNGARVADDVAGACRDREVVLTMLADDESLEALTTQSGGIIESLPAGAVHVPMGTHGVTILDRLAKLHDEAGQVLVAAPVLGRPEAAAAGQLGIVPAGPRDTVARLEPLFLDIGRRTFDGGTNPAGAAAVKLANNMVLGCAIEAMGEGFALTRKFGVDPKSFYEVMTEGLFSAPAYKVYGAIIANQTYDQVGFTTALGLKDTRLMLAAGEVASVPLPSLSVYRDRLLGAIAHGEGELDWAVVARDQARASGLDS
jgi:3-hydroxyisobutyrate dehydrogenase-like beta-hydroxyacid dehydrogenase